LQLGTHPETVEHTDAFSHTDEMHYNSAGIPTLLPLVLVMKNLFLTLIFLICAASAIAQKAPQEREDSLNRISVRTRHSSEKQVYLLDSMALTNARVFNKVARYTRYVQFVKNQDEFAFFYAHTGRTIVIDGKLANAKNNIFDTHTCKSVRAKRISPTTLFKDFGVVNDNGGILIRCKR
jgi:hypothetical protein